MSWLLRNQRGFTLVQAIFILVVLAVLGATMVSLSAVQSRTSVYGLQGARAYHAARSGLEWGIARAMAGSCDATRTFTVEGFTVEVGCTANSVSEAGETYFVFTLDSQARSAGWPSPNYVSRRLEARVAGP